MVDREKLFKDVQKNYDKAVKCIRDLGKKVKEAVVTEDVEAVVRAYDYILQSVLLKEALSDGVVVAEELALIQNVVNHGDVMQVIKKSAPEKYASLIDWESVYLLPAEMQRTLSEKVDALVKEYSGDFALFVALADMATRKDYAQILADCTTDILASFSLFSSGDSVRALEAGAEAFEDMFVEKYVNILRKIDAFCSAAEFVAAAQDFVLSELERYEKQALRDKRKTEIRQKFQSAFRKKKEEETR